MSKLNLRKFILESLQNPSKENPIKVEYQNDVSGSVVYIRKFKKSKYLTMTAFLGTSSKPYINYQVACESGCKSLLEQFMVVENELLNRLEAEKHFQHSCKLGDVFVRSWGHEQTNVNFYQVVKITKKTVSVQEINKSKSYSGEQSMSGMAKALLNDFINNTVTNAKVDLDHVIRIQGYSARLAKCDDQGNFVARFSEYA